MNVKIQGVQIHPASFRRPCAQIYYDLFNLEHHAGLKS